MSRKLIGLVLSALALGSTVALSPASLAATPQIVDPALDHPVPFEDIVSVSLKLATAKGKEVLETTFTMNGDISDPSRNVMTGYNFTAKVGKCDLIVAWYAYPQATEPAGLPTGSAGASCGANGKNLGGTFKYAGKTVIVMTPMVDLKSKGIIRGAVMTKLGANTVPLQGFNGDDLNVLIKAGDTATGAKPWTIA